ncbi:MAG: hypothetical protein LH609_03880 [Rudanella sp.]|nr:hypothetical protein [Rudanella sp.]
MATLRTLFDVTHATIGNWFSAWTNLGIVGLRNQAGQGRKSILVPTDLDSVKAKVQQNPQHLKAVREELKTELNKNFSERTLRRFLKSLVRLVGNAGVNA